MFKIGDEVQIKSGGPVMTIESVTGEKVVTIWWRDELLMRDTFIDQTLKKYESTKSQNM